MGANNQNNVTRGKASRTVYKKMKDHRMAMYCCQRTIRNRRIGMTWPWWQLWLAIKPQLKCTQFAKFKAEYEEKIAMAEANIDKATQECARVTKEYERLAAEKQELVLALQSGGSAVQDIIDKTNRIEAQKNDLQKQLDDLNKRIKGEEDQKNNIVAQQGKVHQDADRLRDEVKTLETALTNNEDDKTTKDNQIRTLLLMLRLA